MGISGFGYELYAAPSRGGSGKNSIFVVTARRGKKGAWAEAQYLHGFFGTTGSHALSRNSSPPSKNLMPFLRLHYSPLTSKKRLKTMFIKSRIQQSL